MKISPVRVEYDRLAAHYDRRWQPYIEVTLSSVIEALEFQGDEELYCPRGGCWIRD